MKDISQGATLGITLRITEKVYGSMISVSLKILLSLNFNVIHLSINCYEMMLSFWSAIHVESVINIVFVTSVSNLPNSRYVTPWNFFHPKTSHSHLGRCTILFQNKSLFLIIRIGSIFNYFSFKDYFCVLKNWQWTKITVIY